MQLLKQTESMREERKGEPSVMSLQMKIDRLEAAVIQGQTDFAVTKKALEAKVETLEQELDELRRLVKNPSRERRIREKDGYVSPFDEQADS